MILNVLQLIFLNWSNLSIYAPIKIQKSTKHPIGLMIFLLRKQYFEKIITRGERELIVLNPFLDSLCNSAFKNICLTPGIPNGCCQHPQDVVINILYQTWQKPLEKNTSLPSYDIAQTSAH